MSTSQKYYCQCFCSPNELQLTLVSARDLPLLAGRSDPVSYQVTLFFPQSPGAHETLCAPTKWIFCFTQACGVPGLCTGKTIPKIRETLNTALPVLSW